MCERMQKWGKSRAVYDTALSTCQHLCEQSPVGARVMLILVTGHTICILV